MNFPWRTSLTRVYLENDERTFSSFLIRVFLEFFQNTKNCPIEKLLLESFSLCNNVDITKSKSDISRLKIICTVILHTRFFRCENFTEMSNFHLLNKILVTKFECEWCFRCRFEFQKLFENRGIKNENWKRWQIHLNKVVHVHL